MIRSTRVQRAERLSAAQRLLADEISLAEAAMALSRAFGLSRRQAYRDLELVRGGRSAASTAETSMTITVKMPASLARALRAYASEHGVSKSEVVRQAVAALLTTQRRHG